MKRQTKIKNKSILDDRHRENRATTNIGDELLAITITTQKNQVLTNNHHCCRRYHRIRLGQTIQEYPQVNC